MASVVGNFQNILFLLCMSTAAFADSFDFRDFVYLIYCGCSPSITFLIPGIVPSHRAVNDWRSGMHAPGEGTGKISEFSQPARKIPPPPHLDLRNCIPYNGRAHFNRIRLAASAWRGRSGRGRAALRTRAGILGKMAGGIASKTGERAFREYAPAVPVPGCCSSAFRPQISRLELVLNFLVAGS